jgi:hypothetical protein
VGRGAGIVAGPGVSAYELLDRLGDDIARLLVFGSNPVVSRHMRTTVTDRLRS